MPRGAPPRDPADPGGASAGGRAPGRAHPLPAAGRRRREGAPGHVTALGLLRPGQALVRLTRVPPFILPAPEAVGRGARHLPRSCCSSRPATTAAEILLGIAIGGLVGALKRAPARLLRGGTPLAAAAPRRQPGAARVRARPAARPLDGLRHGVEGRDGGPRHFLPGHLGLLRRPEARRARLARAGAGDERPARRHALAHPRPRRPAGDGVRASGSRPLSHPSGP